MHRRTFVRLLAASSAMPASPFRLAEVTTPGAQGRLRVTRQPKTPGMPGPFPGRVMSVKSDKSVDTADRAGKRRGRARDDGARHAHADRRRHDAGRLAPLLRAVGRRRHQGQLRRLSALHLRRTRSWPRPSASSRASACRCRRSTCTSVFRISSTSATTRLICPSGLQIVAAERANRNIDNSGYDPATYLEANLFGEEDTRSNMMRLVSKRLTKIINIPNMKDHGATGVTGCLKNIAYGSFSNVARTHQGGKSHTYSVVGTLAGDRAAALENRAADHGWPARRLARRSVCENDTVRLLSAPDHVRHRSGGDRSPAARHHRGQAPRGGRALHLGPLASLAEDGRHTRARRRSERQHHHQGTGPHRVRLDARPRRLRPRADRLVQDIAV